jgi:ketosteroid isomerase-like protein
VEREAAPYRDVELTLRPDTRECSTDLANPRARRTLPANPKRCGVVGTVQRFIQALSELERSGEVEALVSLFAPDCELHSALSPEPSYGLEGARRFFLQYRQSFDRVCSTYRAIIAGEGQAALEWRSAGRTRAGEPFHYSGVSVIEFSGPRISRLAAYFDPAALEALAPTRQPEVEPTLLTQPELH